MAGKQALSKSLLSDTLKVVLDKNKQVIKVQMSRGCLDSNDKEWWMVIVRDRGKGVIGN